MERDWKIWLTPATLVACTAVLAGVIWAARPAPAADAPDSGAVLGEIRDELQGLREEAEAIRTETARSRCELDELNNSQRGRPNILEGC